MYLFEKLTGKSPGPQKKGSIRGASPGVSYKLRNKNAIGRRRWNITTQERKFVMWELEKVKNVKSLTDDGQHLIKKGSGAFGFCALFVPHLAILILHGHLTSPFGSFG